MNSKGWIAAPAQQKHLFLCRRHLGTSQMLRLLFGSAGYEKILFSTVERMGRSERFMDSYRNQSEYTWYSPYIHATKSEIISSNWNANLLNYCWRGFVSFRVGIGSYGLMDQHISWGPWGIGYLSWPIQLYIGTSVRIQHIYSENHHSKLVHSGIHFFIDFPSLICLFMYINDVWIY